MDGFENPKSKPLMTDLLVTQQNGTHTRRKLDEPPLPCSLRTGFVTCHPSSPVARLVEGQAEGCELGEVRQRQGQQRPQRHADGAQRHKQRGRRRPLCARHKQRDVAPVDGACAACARRTSMCVTPAPTEHVYNCTLTGSALCAAWRHSTTRQSGSHLDRDYTRSCTAMVNM